MELLKQKVTEALESCREDSEEMASGFKQDAELHQQSPETQGGYNRNRKGVYCILCFLYCTHPILLDKSYQINILYHIKCIPVVCILYEVSHIFERTY